MKWQSLKTARKRTITFLKYVGNVIRRNPYATAQYQNIQRLEKQLQEIKDEPVKNAWLLSSPRTFWWVWIVCVFVWYAAFRSLSFLYLIIASFILSMAMENLIRFFQRRFSRWFSIGVWYIILLVFVLSWVIIVIPFVIWQMFDLFNLFIEKIIVFQQTLQRQWLENVVMNSSLPEQVSTRIVEKLANDTWWGSLQDLILSNVSQLVSLGTSSIKDAWWIAVNIVSSFFAAIFQVSIVFVCAIFFTIEKDKVIHLLATMSKSVTKTELLLLKLYRKLWFWLEWQLILCVAVGLMVRVGLTILWRLWFPMPNVFTLALIAWLTEFIPYLWPFLGMLPALFVGAIAYWFRWVVAILFLYWLVQQSENNILVPMVMYHTLWVSPLLIFISMIVGWSIFGFLWILLAVPIAVITNILYDGYQKSSQRTVSQ